MPRRRVAAPRDDEVNNDDNDDDDDSYSSEESFSSEDEGDDAEDDDAEGEQDYEDVDQGRADGVPEDAEGNDGGEEFNDEEEYDDEEYDEEEYDEEEYDEEQEESEGETKLEPPAKITVSEADDNVESDNPLFRGRNRMDRDDPQFCPRSQAFYLHDDRFSGRGKGRKGGKAAMDEQGKGGKAKKLWDPVSDEAWTHDKFEELNLANDEPPRYRDSGKGGKGKRKNKKQNARQHRGDNAPLPTPVPRGAGNEQSMGDFPSLSEQSWQGRSSGNDEHWNQQPEGSRAKNNTGKASKRAGRGGGPHSAEGSLGPGGLAVYASGPNGPVMVSVAPRPQLAGSFGAESHGGNNFAPQGMPMPGSVDSNNGMQQWSSVGHYSTMPMMMMRTPPHLAAANAQMPSPPMYLGASPMPFHGAPTLKPSAQVFVPSATAPAFVPGQRADAPPRHSSGAHSSMPGGLPLHNSSYDMFDRSSGIQHYEGNSGIQHYEGNYDDDYQHDEDYEDYGDRGPDEYDSMAQYGAPVPESYDPIPRGSSSMGSDASSNKQSGYMPPSGFVPMYNPYQVHAVPIVDVAGSSMNQQQPVGQPGSSTGAHRYMQRSF